MNDEILQIAKYLKNKINAGEGVDEYDWQEIIDVCDELLRISSLEPVAWMYPVFHDKKMQFTTDAVTSENIDIHFQSHGSPFKVTPLYKLD